MNKNALIRDNFEKLDKLFVENKIPHLLAAMPEAGADRYSQAAYVSNMKDFFNMWSSVLISFARRLDKSDVPKMIEGLHLLIDHVNEIRSTGNE